MSDSPASWVDWALTAYPRKTSVLNLSKIVMERDGDDPRMRDGTVIPEPLGDMMGVWTIVVSGLALDLSLNLEPGPWSLCASAKKKLGDFIVPSRAPWCTAWSETGCDSTLAMSSCDDVSRILAYILCDFAPSSFHCRFIASPRGYHPIDIQFSSWKGLWMRSRRRISEESMTLWMVKKNAMKNKVELREEREID